MHLIIFNRQSSIIGCIYCIDLHNVYNNPILSFASQSNCELNYSPKVPKQLLNLTAIAMKSKMNFELEKQWREVSSEISKNFGEEIDLQTILFLIGMQGLLKKDGTP